MKGQAKVFGSQAPSKLPKRQRTPAGYLPRLGAALIDGVAFALPDQVLTRFLPLDNSTLGGAGLTLFVHVLWLSVFLYFYYAKPYSKTGQSYGKRFFNIRVQRLDGGGFLPVGSAIFRETIGKGLTMLPLGLGLIPLIIRPDRRAVHDLVSGTEVVSS